MFGRGNWIAALFVVACAAGFASTNDESDIKDAAGAFATALSKGDVPGGKEGCDGGRDHSFLYRERRADDRGLQQAE